MADILDFGPTDPWRPPKPWVTAGVIVLAVAASVGLYVSHSGRPEPRATPAPGNALVIQPRQLCAQISASGATELSGVAIAGVSDGAGHALDRCDRDATTGPETATIRRVDGSLGAHGAVLTFPAQLPIGRRDVSGDGVTTDGLLVWKVDGALAQIRGDLSRAEMATIAAGTRIVHGRPVPPTLPGYVLASSGSYRPSAIHEIHYASGAVGESAALGDGQVYTGLVSGGEFEDEMYASHATIRLRLAGGPAVLSTVFGGTATIAWEPAPGLVAYIGYNGTPLDADAVAALVRLARRARLLTSAQWVVTDPASSDETP